MIRRFVACMAASAAALLPAGAIAQPKIEEKVLGPLVDDHWSQVLPSRGGRMATVVAKGEGGVVVVDGVEGPAFDQIVDSRFVEVSLPPELNDPRALHAVRDLNNTKGSQLLLFSDDGGRYAYACAMGPDFVVIADGKEVFRTPFAEYNGLCAMRFSPGGKHLCFALIPGMSGPGHGFRMVMDGKASDLSYLQPFPVFSPDGEHYACVTTNPADPEDHTLIVDGKPAPYKGVRPKLDANGRVFSVTVDPETSKETLQLDGTPWFTASRVDGVYAAPTGENAAAVGNLRNAELFVNGESVAAAQAIEDVIWSPDGKRYAARCVTANHTRYVVLDGANGPELQNITDVAFSPDSRKLVYVGFMNGQHHVVLDNEGVLEGAASMVVRPLFYGPGHEVAFVQARSSNDMALVMGEQMIGGLTNVTGLLASPDGSRFAFAHGNSGAMNVVIGDVEYSSFQPYAFAAPSVSATDRPTWFAFSPDGKHAAYIVSSREPRGPMGVMIDETLIRTKSTRIDRIRFTPDSRHVFWIESDKPYYRIHLDGEAVAQYDMTPHTKWQVDPGAWQIESDGTLVALGPVGGEVKRFRITPSPATNIETMVANAK